MATRPLFRFVGKVNITVIRRLQGSFVEGDWVEGESTEIVVPCNIQPLNPAEIRSLPESERTREWFKVYSAEMLRTAREGVGGHDADEFLWEGNKYRVMKDLSYKMGVLDHWKVLAARAPLTPQEL